MKLKLANVDFWSWFKFGAIASVVTSILVGFLIGIAFIGMMSSGASMTVLTNGNVGFTSVMRIIMFSGVFAFIGRMVFPMVFKPAKYKKHVHALSLWIGGLVNMLTMALMMTATVVLGGVMSIVSLLVLSLIMAFVTAFIGKTVYKFFKWRLPT